MGLQRRMGRRDGTLDDGRLRGDLRGICQSTRHVENDNKSSLKLNKQQLGLTSASTDVKFINDVSMCTGEFVLFVGWIRWFGF
jgi:hypothetical protein